MPRSSDEEGGNELCGMEKMILYQSALFFKRCSSGGVFETREPGGSLIGGDVNRELCRKQKVWGETQLFESTTLSLYHLCKCKYTSVRTFQAINCNNNNNNNP